MGLSSMQIVAKFLKHVVPGVIKPIMVLWNEVIGFVFVVLAVFIGFSAYRQAPRFSGDIRGQLYLAGAFAFAGLLALYGLLSFRRARKISRS
jgi:hypothetical protein